MKWSDEKHIFEVFSDVKALLGLAYLHSSSRRRVQTISSTGHEVVLRVDYRILFFKFYDIVYFRLTKDQKKGRLSLESTLSMGIKRRARMYFSEINNRYLYYRATHKQKAISKKLKHVEPPWKKYPDFHPGDMFWRQAGEYYLDLIWEPFWLSKTDSEKAKYLREFPAPDEWLDFLEYFDSLP